MLPAFKCNPSIVSCHFVSHRIVSCSPNSSAMIRTCREQLSSNTRFRPYNASPRTYALNAFSASPSWFCNNCVALDLDSSVWSICGGHNRQQTLPGRCGGDCRRKRQAVNKAGAIEGRISVAKCDTGGKRQNVAVRCLVQALTMQNTCSKGDAETSSQRKRKNQTIPGAGSSQGGTLSVMMTSNPARIVAARRGTSTSRRTTDFRALISILNFLAGAACRSRSTSLLLTVPLVAPVPANLSIALRTAS